jgi:tetratricopeptide (TPR) repeat protein
VLAAAVAAHPADVPLRLAVASLAGRADPKAGLAAIDVAAKAVGDRAAFRLARAGYLTRVGADRAAVEAVADGAEALPPAERFALFVGLGELLAAGRNEPAAAVPWLRKAIAADRFDVRSRGLLAEVLVGLGRDAEADAAVADLAALEGADGPHVLYARAARLVADRAKAAEARALLEAVAAKRESWGRPHLLLARLAEADGQPDAAIDRYQRAYALGERGDAVVRPLANLLVARGRYAEAVALLEGRERDGRLAADERQQLAAAEALAGRRTERTAAAVKAAETSNDPKDHLFRGRLLLLDGKPADAAAAFERAVALGPTLTEAWVERVYALRLAGRADAAKAAAARAEAALKGPAALVPLGRIRALIDDPAGAERLYLDALRQSPADPEPRVQLAVLLRAAGRADEADARLRELLATAAPDATKRWARRTLAESLAARPDGYRRLSEAVALVDENLTAANAPEDRRAKGLLLSIDPFRRAEARDLIRSAAGSPATPDESARVGLLMEQEGDLAAAEDAFREAVRGPLPQPGHLEMLHRVLVARKRPAGDVLARLKAVEPAGWPAAVAEARQLAADGKPGDAADRLLAFPAAKDAAFRAGRVAPLLADLGCPAEAERVLRESGQRVPLASFLARAGRWREAVELVNSLAPAECPPRARAGLLRAAFGVSRRAVVKPSDHPAWDRAADEAERWLAAQAAAAPADPVFPASLGVLADARGRADEAIRAYETALALSPDLPDARNNLAALLLARGDAPDRPLELMNRAIELAGPQPHLLDTRATVRLAAGKPHDAIRDLEAAVAVSRKPVYLFHLAQAHEKAGNGGLKLEYVERAVRAGLRRPHLHPAEWEEYDRLVGG